MGAEPVRRETAQQREIMGTGLKPEPRQIAPEPERREPRATVHLPEPQRTAHLRREPGETLGLREPAETVPLRPEPRATVPLRREQRETERLREAQGTLLQPEPALPRIAPRLARLGMQAKGPRPPAERDRPAERVPELQPRTVAAEICRPPEAVPARQRAPGNPGEAAAHSAAGVRPLLAVRARAARPVAVAGAVGEELAVAEAGVEDAEVAVDVAEAAGEPRFVYGTSRAK